MGIKGSAKWQGGRFRVEETAAGPLLKGDCPECGDEALLHDWKGCYGGLPQERGHCRLTPAELVAMARKLAALECQARP